MDIKKLESWSDWYLWKQKITNVLVLHGFGIHLKRDTKPTRRDGETQSAFNAKLQEWEDLQRQSVAIVRSSLGILVDHRVKGMTTLSEVMDALDRWFQDHKNIAFRTFYLDYELLTLEGCANLAEYIDKLVIARAQLEQLDESCKISDPFFITKFLNGLGGDYATCRLCFHQTHSLLPEYEDGRLIKPAATFHEAVGAARLHESMLKTRLANLGVTSMRSREALPKLP